MVERRLEREEADALAGRVVGCVEDLEQRRRHLLGVRLRVGVRVRVRVRIRVRVRVTVRVRVRVRIKGRMEEVGGFPGDSLASAARPSPQPQHAPSWWPSRSPPQLPAA